MNEVDKPGAHHTGGGVIVFFVNTPFISGARPFV